MSQKCWSALSFLLTASLFLHSAANAQVGLQARSILTKSGDENRLISLRGNTRPEASRSNDRGAVADDTLLAHLFLQLKRSPEQEQALEDFIEELHDPNSPNFHRWLTAKEFGERFGLAKQDLDTVTNWLESEGFSVHGVYPNLVVDFSGTVRQIREAFHTEIHHLFVNGEAHQANMSDPQIPEALEPAVVGIASLHNFMPHRLIRPVPQYTIGAGVQAVVPQDLATIYNFNPAFNAGYSGQGQTIVALEDSNVYSTGDWLVFRKVFGLARPYPEGSLVEVHPQPSSGKNNCFNPGSNSDEAEAIVDAEWASAAAPSARIELASCANTFNFGGFIALQNLLTNGRTPPAIVSIGFGIAEASLGAANNKSISELYKLAVSRGVSIFVSSGDGGAATSDTGSSAAFNGIGVSGYASTPYNVSVGGTDFADGYFGRTADYWKSKNSPTFGSALSYIPEIPWNNSCASALLAQSNGFSTSYGRDGYCNSGGPLTTFAGGGGPSGCALGSPTLSGIVSGSCAGYRKPSWQHIVGNPNDGVRDTPDVSLFAAVGNMWNHYSVVCYSDPAFADAASCLGPPSTWAGFGGTSVSAPVVAGIQALVNQKTGSRWGNPNPVYYRLAAREYRSTSCNSDDLLLHPTCTFHDITLGDINVDCFFGSVNCYLGSNPGLLGVLSTSDKSFRPAYRAKPGWDFATGIGSVDVWRLLDTWGTALGTPAAAPFTPVETSH